MNTVTAQQMTPRTGLLRRLGTPGAGVAALTLLHAPAGYGKTTTIRQWAAEQERRGTAVYRVSAAPLDSGKQLWPRITAAVSGARWAAPRGTRETVLRWARRLKVPTVLVIDDYHQISCARTDRALADIVMDAPNLRLVVLARRVVALENPLITSGLDVMVLGRDDLQMTREEVDELASGSGVWDGAVCDAVLNDYDGWPIAARSLMGARRNGLSAAEASEQLAAALCALVDGELDMKVLTAIAVCEGCSEDILAEELGVDQAEIRRVFDRLEDLGVAGRQRTGPQAPMVCARGLREFLVRHALRIWSPERLQALQLRFADQTAQARPVDALLTYLHLGALTKADKTALQYFPAVVSETPGIMEALRTSSLRDLQGFQALLLMRLVLERCSPSIPVESVEVTARLLRDATLEQAAEAQDEQVAVSAATLGMTERVLGDWNSAHRITRDLFGYLSQPHVERVSNEWKTLPVICNSSSLTFLLMGDIAQALDAATLAERSAIAQGNHAAQAHALALSALTSVLKGEVEGAQRYLEESDRIATAGNAVFPEYTWADAEIARMLIAAHTGELDAGKAAAALVLPHMDRMEQWPLAAIAEALFYRRAKGTKEAFIRLNRRLAHRPGVLSVAPASESALQAVAADLAILEGNYEAAERHIDEMDQRSLQHRVRRAALALFQGRERRALALATKTPSRNELAHQGMGDQGAETARLALIGATAAWRLGHKSEALRLFRDATPQLAGPLGCTLLSTMQFDAACDLATASGNPGLMRQLEGLPVACRVPTRAVLSAAEERTLKQLSKTASTTEIADDMFVSVNTVKFHLRNLYKKLDVANRNQALDRATLLGYL